MYAQVLYPQVVDIRKKKQYASTPNQRQKGMTIVVGLRCQDGLVLCADEEISFPGSHSYQEEKITLIDMGKWCAALGYAGSPLTMKALKKDVIARFLLEQDEIVNSKRARSIVDELLDEMHSKKQYGKFDQLLVAVSSSLETPELFVLTPPQKRLLPAEDFTCLGVGESALIQYLKSMIYSADITTDFGKNVGIYLVAKAIQHIEGCGPPIDTVVLKDGGTFEWVSKAESQERRAAMQYVEREALLKIVDAGRKI